MSNIRLIIMDVDGTLTNGKKIITEKTKAALICKLPVVLEFK